VEINKDNGPNMCGCCGEYLRAVTSHRQAPSGASGAQSAQLNIRLLERLLWTTMFFLEKSTTLNLIRHCGIFMTQT
jgi:hypothetical protein